MNKLPLAKTKNTLVQQTQNETLIYNLENNQVFCLNETAAFIWQNCDGKKTLTEIKNMSGQLLDDDFIFLTLGELNKVNLLENIAEDLPIAKLNRRQMIAKYGSMAIVFPMITAVIAPKAVNAQSGCVNPTATIPAPGSCLECPPVTSIELKCCEGFEPALTACDSIRLVCVYGCVAIK